MGLFIAARLLVLSLFVAINCSVRFSNGYTHYEIVAELGTYEESVSCIGLRQKFIRTGELQVVQIPPNVECPLAFHKGVLKCEQPFGFEDEKEKFVGKSMSIAPINTFEAQLKFFPKKIPADFPGYPIYPKDGEIRKKGRYVHIERFVTGGYDEDDHYVVARFKLGKIGGLFEIDPQKVQMILEMRRSSRIDLKKKFGLWYGPEAFPSFTLTFFIQPEKKNPRVYSVRFDQERDVWMIEPSNSPEVDLENAKGGLAIFAPKKKQRNEQVKFVKQFDLKVKAMKKPLAENVVAVVVPKHESQVTFETEGFFWNKGRFMDAAKMNSITLGFGEYPSTAVSKIPRILDRNFVIPDLIPKRDSVFSVSMPSSVSRHFSTGQ